MNLTKQECDEWKANPSINPRTQRKIKVDGSVYKQIAKSCNPDTAVTKEHCGEFKKDPTRHPVTKRKLNQKAKNGIFAQLKRLCDSPQKPVKSKSPTIEDDLEKQRKNLIQAIKKAIAPVLHKGDTLEARKQFAKIINNYLTNVQPCLEEKEKKLVLLNKSKQPIVTFEKQIGSKSVYGMAYMNMGKSFAKLLKFSCKLMTVDDNKEEVKILKKMTEMAMRESCPNMPITYDTLKCSKKCKHPTCPDLIKSESYYVVINELANYDIQNWMKEKHSSEDYQSIIMQMLFAVYAFHNMKYIHNDCHLGNFLIHKIKPGGCWRYKIANHDVFIPNTGYQLVMWDPGLASPYYNHMYDGDYFRFLDLLIHMPTYKMYQDMKLKYMPDDIVNYGLVPISNIILHTYKNEEGALNSILENIKTNVIKFPSIVVDNKPPDFLLNVKPYTCK